MRTVKHLSGGVVESPSLVILKSRLDRHSTGMVYVSPFEQVDGLDEVHSSPAFL